MRKRWLSLLLALVMLASVTVTTASADTVNLLDKTVTLSVTPSQSAICVGSTGDVYVKYTISIKADAPIPAFSFVVPTDGKLATQAQTNNSDWYYWFNTDELMQWDEAKETGGHGPYKVADYTPTTGYVGVGGSDGNGISAKTEVMTIVAKFPAGSTAETYTPAFADEDFIAGGGETIDSGGIKVSNAFGRRHVQVGSVNVKAGTTVSGTVKDSSGKAVSGATVELYKDDTKVGTSVTTDSNGKYTFSDVSTGTYTVKARSSDGSLNGSAEITVKADNIPDAHVTVAKGVTVSGTIKNYGSASEAVTVTLLQGTSVIGSPQVLTGASGSVPYSQNYSFPAVPAGTYTLKVEKKGHAPWTEEIAVGSAAIAKDVTIYLWGDVNGDGSADSTDLNVLFNITLEYISVESLTATQRVTADINKDGDVDSTDLNMLFNHVLEYINIHE